MNCGQKLLVLQIHKPLSLSGEATSVNNIGILRSLWACWNEKKEAEQNLASEA